VNVLTLIPGGRHVEFAAFRWPAREPVIAGSLEISQEELDRRDSLETFLDIVAGRCRSHRPTFRIETVAIRAVYGGETFRRPAVFCPEVRRRLDSLIPEAPLEAPVLIALADRCRHTFPAASVLLVFETSFFLDLPPEEREYAVPEQEGGSAAPLRYGFHGITHAAACARARTELAPSGEAHRTRIISVFLDDSPEVAAVLGDRPLMSTSGSSPLQGLPGRTSCGDLDPGIVLALAGEHKWGPEEINACLTGESGLVGLAGRQVEMSEVFSSRRDATLNLAREVLEYRLLLACGAAKATLGGLDAIVFSGRHAQLARYLTGPLLSALVRGEDRPVEAPTCMVFAAPLEVLVTEEALSFLAGDSVAFRSAGREEDSP